MQGFNAKFKTTCYSKTKIAIIGAGFGGLAMAIRLLQSQKDFVILEKTNDVGGTWRENQYPVLLVMFNHTCIPCLLHPKQTGQNVMLKLLKFLNISKILPSNIKLKTIVSLIMKLLMHSMMKIVMYGT
jgi:UDP-galactopyranose mutase